ncbi:acyl-CoA dehydrogenase family protein [Mycobacterium branderi]|uniref:Acyl-CoA dehydrogenase n=1 Tax=Mycobacterium branderi TaxID=43348 RepID=A0A7I7WG78_9MYCO|nr:acyl-CoA dehydrogenase family protein [Mycobacterium branderi]MCV7235198.1 acyl-CoA/acyl-ACP dehydrogenase [Mycobacterium branderi]ORA31845.1 acyl-CoA dehydrogenase [Mycobacterium branderi]BBZ14968.1 acyl-CoA dehydrogenase [Mycobacterium branderi]
MTFTLTEEQHELASSVAAFLEKRSPETEVRRLMEQGGAADPAVWSQLAGQLGLTGLIVGEEYGGAGSGFLDFALVAERTGAALLVAPLLSTVAAAGAIMLSCDEQLKSDYLPALAGGERIGTLALAEASASWDPATAQASAEPAAGGQVRLTGTKMYVVDGQHADIFVVSARSPLGSIGLYVVDANRPEVTVTALSTLDLTRPQARVEFDAAPARPLSDEADAAAVAERAVATAAIMLAAEQVGGAQKCLDMAVEYAKVRVQFGRPIGSFQAIKHKCADMLLDVESARSAAYWAAGVLDDDSDNPLIAAAVAKAHCSAAYTRVAGENIQIHGGIGFTWEHPAHLYFKRAKTSEIIFGDPAWQRERLAELVGI